MFENAGFKILQYLAKQKSVASSPVEIFFFFPLRSFCELKYKITPPVSRRYYFGID